MKGKTLKATAVAAILLAPSTLAPAQDAAPDATVDVTGGSVAAGVGYTWGRGTLHYQGKDYPFTLKGLSVPAVGAERIQASGEVFHLASLADFGGNYTPVSAGPTVAARLHPPAIKNQNAPLTK